MEQFVYKNNRKLRCGYTTGTCAAAAALGAAAFLLSKKRYQAAAVILPSKESLFVPVEAVWKKAGKEEPGFDKALEEAAFCRVRKDAGDDADVTNGMAICAKVWKKETPDICIIGGKGIGRVTKKGLSIEPGEAAINPVPRKMIENALKDCMKTAGYQGGLYVEIFAPEGEKIANKTMNPVLGVVGGISILGTSGIVEPMSEKAYLDTIRTQLSMRIADGKKYVLLVPGNYGMDFIEKELGISSEIAVKCSNFIGETVDMAFEYGIEGMLLVGHMGKLVKLGAGIMDTHSKNGDGRMEVLCACGLEAGAQHDLLLSLLHCVATDEAVLLLKEQNLLEAVMEILMKRIAYYLSRRGYEGLQIGAITFSNRFGLLGMTTKAEDLLKKLGG